MKNSDQRHFYLSENIARRVSAYADSRGVREKDAVKILIEIGLSTQAGETALNQGLQYLTKICEGAFIEIGKAAFVTIDQNRDERSLKAADQAKISFKSYFDKAKANAQYSDD